MKAFMLTSMPFVLAEATTGIISFFTGSLAIPPLMGVGTAIDIAILLVGMLFVTFRTLGWQSRKGERKGMTGDASGPG